MSVVKMQSTPTKKEFLPASTPVTHWDSGYFGSCDKSLISKAFHTLSPIKEASPGKKRFCNLKSGIFYSPSKDLSSFETPCNVKVISSKDERTGLSSPNVVKELNFNESSDYFENSCNEKNESLKEYRLTTIFPLFPWSISVKKYKGTQNCERLQKDENKISSEEKREVENFKNTLFCYNKSKEKIDILDHLKKRNCHQILSDLLSYFPAEDLCRMKGVSKTWKEIILKDAKANFRRKEFLKNMKHQMENRAKSRVTVEICDRYDRTTVFPKLILCDITNVVPPSEQLSSKQYNTKFNSFVEAGRNLQSGPLMKCPRCSYAAKAQNGDEYICTDCKHIFCKKCLSPFVKSHDCPKLQVPMLVIGSKQCKKNLRRL